VKIRNKSETDRTFIRNLNLSRNKIMARKLLIFIEANLNNFELKLSKIN